MLDPSDMIDTSIVKKPWGHYKDLHREETLVCKKLTILPGERISLQIHKLRSEMWFIKSGHGILTIDSVETIAYEGDIINIRPNQAHRIFNTSFNVPLVIYEMQCGICKEDDIVRIADDYGRD
jgi:mannose-1-phosphate guanylyltransferase